MEEVLALTGDPARVGDFPGATSVYDLSSIELIKMIEEMNDGRSVLGNPLDRQQGFLWAVHLTRCKTFKSSG